MDISSIDYDTIFISYGRDNNGQAYGGGTCYLINKEIKPCYLPIYAREYEATVYIYIIPGGKKLYLGVYSNAAEYIARFMIYYK